MIFTGTIFIMLFYTGDAFFVLTLIFFGSELYVFGGCFNVASVNLIKLLCEEKAFLSE